MRVGGGYGGICGAQNYFDSIRFKAGPWKKGRGGNFKTNQENVKKGTCGGESSVFWGGMSIGNRGSPISVSHFPRGKGHLS